MRTAAVDRNTVAIAASRAAILGNVTRPIFTRSG
jgi:hypothetical protein